MDEIIAKFKKSDKACFCAAALIISNVLSIFTTASGFRNLLESFIVGLLLSVVVQAFKLLCEWRIGQGMGTLSDRLRRLCPCNNVFSAVLDCPIPGSGLLPE